MKNPKYRPLYRNSYNKGIGRLAQEMPGLSEGKKIICFVEKKAIPPYRWMDVTYGRFVVDHRSEKNNPYQTKITVGGYRVNYPGDCRTPTNDLNTVKLLLNSIV